MYVLSKRTEKQQQYAHAIALSKIYVYTGICLSVKKVERLYSSK